MSDLKTAQRIKRLEDALIEYMERYGATDLAREALQPPEMETTEYYAAGVAEAGAEKERGPASLGTKSET
jgi:hypothetical protein